MLTQLALLAVLLPVAEVHISLLPVVAANYSGFINRDAAKPEPTPLIIPPAKKKKFNFDFDFDLPEDEPEAVLEDTPEAEPAVVKKPVVAPEPVQKIAPPMATQPPAPRPDKPAVLAKPKATPKPSPEAETTVTVAPIEPAVPVKPATRFNKLNNNGTPAAANETWSCVVDSESGLVWEVKTRDGGLRDTNHSYTWYDPAQNPAPGIADGGRCAGGIDCDTYSYPLAMNQQTLCGFSDWRLPTRDELQTLVSFNSAQTKTTIDIEYFPEAIASWYWTASSNAGSPQYAWYVLFRNGVPLNDLKQHPKHIRLVRGTQPSLASKQ